MYSTHRLLTSVAFIIPLFLSSCGKDDDFIPNDPAVAILGKWKTVQAGNWPHMEPYEGGGFTEYTADSIVLYYDYSQERYTNQGKYWLNDSLLFMGVIYEGAFIGLPYRYEFLDKQSKLRLDYEDDVTAMFKTKILEHMQ